RQSRRAMRATRGFMRSLSVPPPSRIADSRSRAQRLPARTPCAAPALPAAACSSRVPPERHSRPRPRGEAFGRLKYEFHLEADVVAVADRTELPGGGAFDAGVVEDEAEGVADELDARLEDDLALPVVEHAERRHDAAARVRRRDEERLQEAIVVQVKE